MMIWLGVWFASTDLRLCNAYSLQSQVLAGQGLAVLGSMLGVLWLLRLLWQGHGARQGRAASP
jgi:hypothetical protein